MIKNTTYLRVRYNETDQMGIVNNAQYATYFEIGRIELFRELGLEYGQIEKDGLMLPVSELYVRYMQSAFYDDMLRIETFVMLMPTSRFRLDYKIFNQHNEQLAEGYTVLAFFDAINRRPVRIPAVIGDVLKPFFRYT